MAYLRNANVSVRRISVLVLAAALWIGVSTYFASAQATDGGQTTQTDTLKAFQELIETSQKEKKGLTFFVRGQTIAGVVVRTIGADVVEVRNQTYSRVIIRLASVDALAIN